MSKPGYFNADDIATNAAVKAIKLYKQEERENIRKNRVGNTGLLLDHYIDFLDHYEKIKYKASDIQEELDPVELDIITNEDIIIQSIKRSKIRTKIMISQIETAVEMLKVKMKDKPEKYEVVKRLYMDRNKKDMSFNQKVKLVEEEMRTVGIPSSESSVRRWNSEMLMELSVLLFGVDGLKLEL